MVVWRDRVLRNPSNAELAQLVVLAAAAGSESSCDLLVFIGAASCTDWLVGSLALDSGGYVLTEPTSPG